MKRFLFGLFALISASIAFAGSQQQMLMAAKPSAGVVNPFPATNLGEWWDGNTGLAVSGSNPTSWTGALHSTVLTATATVSPMLVETVGAQTYIKFSVPGGNTVGGYFSLPGGFTWNKQAVSWYFFYKRNSLTTDTDSLIWGGTSQDALIFAGQLFERYDVNGVVGTGIYGAENLACYFVRVDATNTKEGISSQIKVQTPAQDTGTITGGNISEYNAPPLFPLHVGALCGILKYDEKTSDATHSAILAAASIKYGTTPESAARYVCFDGDSRTFGSLSTDPVFWSYPAQMARLYSGGQPPYSISAAGGLQAVNNTAATATLLQLSYFTAYSNPTVSYAIGVNDVGAGTNSATIITAIQTWMSNVRASYPTVKLVGCTIFPFAFETVGQTAARTAVNTWILNTTLSTYDYTVDFAGDSRLQNPANLTYFNSDGLHLTDAGYGVCAALEKAVFDAHSLWGSMMYWNNRNRQYAGVIQFRSKFVAIREEEEMLAA